MATAQPVRYTGATQPWRTLIEAAYNKYNGYDISDIHIPSGENLRSIRRVYYDKAALLLSKANLTTLEWFAVFTALSGIVDLRTTHSADLSRFNMKVPQMLEVDPELAKILRELCGPLADGFHALSEECTKRMGGSHQNFWSTDSERDSSPQIKSPREESPIIEYPIIESPIADSQGNPIMEDEPWVWDLARCMLQEDSDDMLMDVDNQDQKEPSVAKVMAIDARGRSVGKHRAMIKLVQYLANVMEQDQFPTDKASIVGHWKNCLEILSGNRLELRTGKGSAALRASLECLHKDLVESQLEFVQADDLVMLVDGLEVLIFTVQETEDALARETLYSENLRLNKTVEVAASAQGVRVREMLPLNIEGMNAMVCALRKMKNGGYLGGAACDFSIRIPKTQVDMENFLAGGAHLLWNYTKLLLEYQDTIRLQRNQAKETLG